MENRIILKGDEIYEFLKINSDTHNFKRDVERAVANFPDYRMTFFHGGRRSQREIHLELICDEKKHQQLKHLFENISNEAEVLSESDVIILGLICGGMIGVIPCLEGINECSYELQTRMLNELLDLCKDYNIHIKENSQALENRYRTYKQICFDRDDGTQVSSLNFVYWGMKGGEIKRISTEMWSRFNEAQENYHHNNKEGMKKYKEKLKEAKANGIPKYMVTNPARQYAAEQCGGLSCYRISPIYFKPDLKKKDVVEIGLKALTWIRANLPTKMLDILKKTSQALEQWDEKGELFTPIADKWTNKAFDILEKSEEEEESFNF